MGLFGAAHGWGRVKKASLPKIWHKYPTMIRLDTVVPYLKKIQKIYKSRDIHSELCWHQHFFTGNQQIILYQEIQIKIAFSYIISNLLTFFESLKISLIQMVTILLMSAKMATLGLLKLKAFKNKGYNVIISVYDLNKTFLSRDSNYVVNEVMWPKVGNSSISIREVIITLII